MWTEYAKCTVQWGEVLVSTSSFEDSLTCKFRAKKTQRGRGHILMGGSMKYSSMKRATVKSTFTLRSPWIPQRSTSAHKNGFLSSSAVVPAVPRPLLCMAGAC